MPTFLGYSNFSGKNGDKFSADLQYDIIERNIPGNYYIVRLYGYIRSWGNYSGSGKYASFYINGVDSGGFNSISISQYSQVAVRDVAVYGDLLGRCTLNWSLSVSTTWTLGSASASGQLVLDTIPRISSVTATDGKIESAISININRASTDFTHNLRYAFGSLTGTIANGVLTSYGWIIPASFYAQIPNSKSGQGVIYCDTYYGGTLIGTSSYVLNVGTDEEKCKPTVTAIIEDTNTSAIALTGDKNKLIKFISNPKIKITATAKDNSTIRNYSVVCADGKSGSGATVTLSKVENGKFTISVTDSRGYTTSIVINKTLINYVPLTTNPTFNRTEPTTGEALFKYDGNYFNGSFGNVANSLSVKFRYKPSSVLSWDGISYKNITPIISGNKYSQEILGTGFDYKTTYDYELIVSDKLTPVIKTGQLLKAIPIRGTFEKFLEHWGIKSIWVDEDGETLVINGNVKIDGSNKKLKDL